VDAVADTLTDHMGDFARRYVTDARARAAIEASPHAS
jgi:hypothetical protein